MVKWVHSEEKERLRKDIIDGVVSEVTNPRIVYDMQDSTYHQFDYNCFKVNMKNLIAAIRKWQNAAVEDGLAFETVVEQWARPNNVPDYPPWHNSSASLLLLQDIDSGAIEGLKPSEIRQTRPEYLAYPLNVFRDHLYKEKSKPMIKAYWEHQRERTLQRKRRRR
jgi:hypothetical protein